MGTASCRPNIFTYMFIWYHCAQKTYHNTFLLTLSRCPIKSTITYWFFSTRNCFTQQFAKWSFIFPLASFVTSTMEKCVELLSKTFKPLKWTRCNNNASNSPKTCLNDKNQSIMRVRSNCTKSKLPKPSDL